MPEIVFSHERVTNQSNLLSYVYWNRNGRFLYGHHTQLPTQGAVANAIGDVNRDGKPDVFFFNTEGGLRDGPSAAYLYWGDGTRNFSAERRAELPVHQIFGIGAADLDDDRRVDLILAQINLSTEWAFSWEAETPHHTLVKFQIRVADTRERLIHAVWHGPGGEDTWYSRSDAKIQKQTGQWIQYRARLVTANVAATPCLTSVSIAFH